MARELGRRENLQIGRTRRPRSRSLPPGRRGGHPPPRGTLRRARRRTATWPARTPGGKAQI